MATEQEVVEVLRYLVAAWPQHEISQQTVAVYIVQLLRRGHAADVLMLAAMNLIDRSAWFPTVAALHEEAERIAHARRLWLATANSQEYGEGFPPTLRLPDRMALDVLGREPARLEQMIG